MSEGSKCGLSTDRWAVLDDLAKAGPMPTLRINAGLVIWFLRENMTEPVMRRSPWSADRGQKIEHQKITTSGRLILEKGAQ